MPNLLIVEQTDDVTVVHLESKSVAGCRRFVIDATHALNSLDRIGEDQKPLGENDWTDRRCCGEV
jgi:hypothetical protein